MIPNDTTLLIYATIRSSKQFHSKSSLVKACGLSPSFKLDKHLVYLSASGWITIEIRPMTSNGGTVHLIRPTFKVFNGYI